MRVVVSGMAARFPLAGVALDYLSYAVGFARLGCDVLYLEDTGDWVYDPEAQTYVEGAAGNAARLARFAGRLGFPGERLCVRDAAGAYHLSTRERAEAFLRGADAIVNVSGALWLREEYRSLRARKVFVDTDPGYNHVWLARAALPGADERLVAAADRIRAHDAHFTFAEAHDRPGCLLPATPGVRWRPTRQPLLLDLARPRPLEGARPSFATIMSGSAHEWDLEWEGRRFGGKARALERWLGLPARCGRRLELAIAGKAPLERLRAAGFALVDPGPISASVDAYLDFLGGARGEWSVAKEAYTALRTGWFSSRTACVLGMGRPAIVEETGQGAQYGGTPGLWTFSSEEDVLRALAAIDADPEGAGEAARALAERWFDAGRVLAELVER